MRASEGEPILTADGRSVAAFWAVTQELSAGNMVFIPHTHRENMMAFDNAAVPIYDPVDRCTIWHHVTMPDGRSYWRISEGAPDHWWENCPWFRDVPVTPSPEPAGMVAAFDLVLSDPRLTAGMVRDDLNRLRDYWAWKSGK